MSSRIRTPERETGYEWDEPARARRRTPPRPPSVRRFGLPIVGAALLLGLLIGYVANSGGGGTTTITETRTVTAPAAAAAPGASGAASRAEISLAVLNGSGESGLAGRTADEARAMGYAQVTEGNAPAPETSDRVLHRAGFAAQARQVATDLGLPAPALVTDADPIAAAADPEDQVIVVLGPSGPLDDAADPGVSSGPDTVAPPAEEGATPVE